MKLLWYLDGCTSSSSTSPHDEVCFVLEQRNEVHPENDERFNRVV